MKLQDLVGEHYLSGVETDTVKVKQYGDYYEDAQVVKFILDGTTYKATEDPDDGYRSYLNELEVCDDELKNTFEKHKVIGKMKPNGEWEINNTIIFTDAITQKVVLEVGTDNTDDYYPYCVLHWQPQNLAINAEK